MKKKAKNQGFQVEKDYFESFEERMLLKLKETQLPTNSGFATPPSYFNGLEDTICDKLLHETKDTHVISLVQRKSVQMALAIAACIALVISIALYQDSASEDSLNLATLTEYIDEGYLDLSAEEVGNLLDEEDLNQMTLIPMENMESIEDYLLEHLDENNLLIE